MRYDDASRQLNASWQDPDGQHAANTGARDVKARAKIAQLALYICAKQMRYESGRQTSPTDKTKNVAWCFASTGHLFLSLSRSPPCPAHGVHARCRCPGHGGAKSKKAAAAPPHMAGTTLQDYPAMMGEGGQDGCPLDWNLRLERGVLACVVSCDFGLDIARWPLRPQSCFCAGTASWNALACLLTGVAETGRFGVDLAMTVRVASEFTLPRPAASLLRGRLGDLSVRSVSGRGDMSVRAASCAWAQPMPYSTSISFTVP